MNLVNRALLAGKAQVDQQDLEENKESKGHKENKVFKAVKDHVAHQGPLVYLVNLDQWEKRAL